MEKKKNKLKKEKKKSKRLFFFILVLAILALLIFIISFIQLINSFMIIEKKDVWAYLIVSDHYGFDLNSSILAFGMVAPGGSVTRKMSIENTHNFPIIVKIVPQGDMEKFIEIHEYIVPANQTKEIGVSAYAPPETSYGKYAGNVSFIMKKYIWKYY